MSDIQVIFSSELDETDVEEETNFSEEMNTATAFTVNEEEFKAKKFIVTKLELDSTNTLGGHLV